jgi:hypothetical protein
MRPLINNVLSKYPSLVCIKYGALKTNPNCPSQYEGHDHCLHSDYKSFFNDLLPDQRPVSLIMALDEFEFIYLPALTMNRKELLTSLFLLVIQFYSPMPVSILVVQIITILFFFGVCTHGE